MKYGFTIIELLISIAILFILVSIILPVTIQVRKNSSKTTCISQLRQIGMAHSMYMSDNDNLPPGNIFSVWPQYISSKQIFGCPQDSWIEKGGWAWVAWGQNNNLAGTDSWPFPMSYVYLPMNSFILKKKTENPNFNPGYVACVLHGEKIDNMPGIPTYFRGQTLRLCLDGSVISKNISMKNGSLFDMEGIMLQ